MGEGATVPRYRCPRGPDLRAFPAAAPRFRIAAAAAGGPRRFNSDPAPPGDAPQAPRRRRMPSSRIRTLSIMTACAIRAALSGAFRPAAPAAPAALHAGRAALGARALPLLPLLPSRALRTVPFAQSGSHEDRIIGLHGEFAGRAGPAADPSHAAHNEAQRKAFDEAAGFFASEEATPSAVVPVLNDIAATVLGSDCEGSAVVDVGCGSGAILPFLLENGLAPEDYVGVDLSSEMLKACGERAAGLGGAAADVRLLQKDLVELTKADVLGAAAADLAPGSAAAHRGGARAVLFNAVFGNLFDQRLALERSAALLTEGGRVVITHPLGFDFLERLRAADPQRVPHALPSGAELRGMARFLPLRLAGIEGGGSGEDPPYKAVLEKGAVALVERPMLLEGQVARGFGRGSKKLGFATANLPESVFAGRLEAVAPGVYCGWAAVGGGGPYRAVVNVGFSPTFKGEENPEKIAEAHLIDYPPDGGEFYGETMRLLLAGRQRPELKFDGFPELVAAIGKDKEDAAGALAQEGSDLHRLRKHPFVADAAPLEGEGVEQVAPGAVWCRKHLDAWLEDC